MSLNKLLDFFYFSLEVIFLVITQFLKNIIRNNVYTDNLFEINDYNFIQLIMGYENRDCNFYFILLECWLFFKYLGIF